MYIRVWVLAAGVLVAGAAAAATDHGAHRAEKSGHTALNAEVELGPGGLREGRRSGVMLRLTHADGDGAFPLFVEELEKVHEHSIHALIIDPALADYHHEHPVQVEKEGSFAFFIKPRTPCSYKMWAQVHFKGGLEEIATATIPGKEECKDRKPDRTEQWTHDAGDYNFTIKAADGKLKKGEDTTLTLAVADKDGAPVEELEPLMGAFAHLVGFYEDYEHIAHMHPEGETPGRHERGGPELSFDYTPERAGMVKLFAQVKIGGKMIFAPFTVIVTE